VQGIPDTEIKKKYNHLIQEISFEKNDILATVVDENH